MLIKTIFCLVLLALGWVSCETLGSPCKVQFLQGTCIPITSCKFAMTILSINDVQTLRSMFCGFEGSLPMVCCPNTSNQEKPTTIPPARPTKRPATTTQRHFTTEEYEYKIELGDNKVTASPPLPTKDPFMLPDRNVCGQIVGGDRIYNGVIPNIDELPWMVRLKMYKPTTGKELFACSGTLISNRYVVTAAHCVTVYKIIGVRLGEWDTDTVIDCQEDGYCNDGPLDVKVDRVVVHPKFDKKSLTGDIALLRLEEPVNFTDFIKPICLPTTEYIARQDYIDSTFTAAGWGKTEFGQTSVLLRKVDVDSVPYSICTTALAMLPKTEDPLVICAGGKRNKDTCQGDSGGPLMRIVGENYKQNWYLYGVTSYGVARCGTAGKPAVYTRVSKYMNWIIDTISTG